MASVWPETVPCHLFVFCTVMASIVPIDGAVTTNNVEACESKHCIDPIGYSNDPPCHGRGTCQCLPRQQLISTAACLGNDSDVCYTCSCNGFYSGRYCEQSGCMAENSNRECSGRGRCVSGMCLCDRLFQRSYSGQFCECDDYSCPYYMDQLCGGSDRGVCRCGQCECMRGWTGTNCGCSTIMSVCMVRKGNDMIECNGHGRCECGMCRCDEWYFGPTCEDCPNCTGVCEKMKSCVQCMAFNTGPYGGEPYRCRRECLTTNWSLYMVDQVQIYGDQKLCKLKDDDDCIFLFNYSYDQNGRMIVKVQTRKDCPDVLNVNK